MTTIVLDPASRQEFLIGGFYPDSPTAYPDFMYPDQPSIPTVASRDSIALSPAGSGSLTLSPA